MSTTAFWNVLPPSPLLPTVCQLRRDDKNEMIFGHLEARRALQQRIVQLNQHHAVQQEQLAGDITHYEALRQDARRTMLEEFRQRRGQSKNDEMALDDETRRDAWRQRLESLREQRAELPSETEAPQIGPRMEQ